jgi:hypothetical protein
MRWLFLFVLVLNLSYVGWELSQPEEVLNVIKADENVPKIVLLSEIGKESVAVSVGKSEPVSGQREEVVAVKGSCYTLGPFNELNKLREVTRGIKKYVVAASYRSHQEKEPAMFWVYLEPAKDYSKAKVLADRLKRAKVKDYFIIKSEPKINGVSLGSFREKDRAYDHAKRITDLGFKPEVEVSFKDYTIYWLDYDVAAGKNIPEGIFDRYLSSKINHLVRDCS